MKKTGYEWCLESNIRILDLNDWPLTLNSSKEKHYFEFDSLTNEEFINALKHCKVKYNSTPRKTKRYLEYRLYGLIPYNISPIQKGIQFSHGLQELNNDINSLEKTSYNIDNIITPFNKWAKEDKTVILLNGGTTNNHYTGKYYGTLQKFRDKLNEVGIMFSEFYEPDLNNALTCVTFLVDERVWDYEKYPNFEYEKLPYRKGGYSDEEKSKLVDRNSINYLKWVKKIGDKNVKLRELIKDLKLA